MTEYVNSLDSFRNILETNRMYFLAKKRIHHTMGSPWDGPYIKGYQDCLELNYAHTEESINNLLDRFTSYVVVIIDNKLFLLSEEDQINKVESQVSDICHELIDCNYRFYVL